MTLQPSRRSNRSRKQTNEMLQYQAELNKRYSTQAIVSSASTKADDDCIAEDNEYVEDDALDEEDEESGLIAIASTKSSKKSQQKDTSPINRKKLQTLRPISLHKIRLELASSPQFLDILSVDDKARKLTKQQEDALLNEAIWDKAIILFTNFVNENIPEKKSSLNNCNIKLTLNLRVDLPKLIIEEFSGEQWRADVEEKYWKVCLGCLVHEFIPIAKRLMAGLVGDDIDEVINDIFTNFDIDNHFGDREDLKRVVYYICGWLALAIKKESTRRKSSKVAFELDNLYRSMIINKDNETEIAHVKTSSLPTSIIEESERHGGLHFVNNAFFTFGAMVESVFRYLQTTRNILFHGTDLIDKIKNRLESNEMVRSRMKDFINNPESSDRHINETVSYVMRTYSRMRGKDFAKKIMQLQRDSKMQLATNTREKQLVLANSSTYKIKKESPRRYTNIALTVVIGGIKYEISDSRKEIIIHCDDSLDDSVHSSASDDNGWPSEDDNCIFEYNSSDNSSDYDN